MSAQASGVLALSGLLGMKISGNDVTVPIYLNPAKAQAIQLVNLAVADGKKIVTVTTAATTTTVSPDLTAITGDGDTAATAFATVNALILIPTTAHASGVEVAMGPNASNGLVTPFGAAAGFVTAYGEYAGVHSPIILCNWPTGWTVDSTHKIIDLNPGTTATGWRLIVIGTT